MTQTKPSAGSMRAAQAALEAVASHEMTDRILTVPQLAELIDRESGLAELLEACKLALADESTASKVAEACQKAIAKASNPNSTITQVAPKGRWTEKGTV